jgi:hypothetical protein
MLVAQLLLPHASHYERKSQQIDAGALSERYELLTCTIDHNTAMTSSGEALPIRGLAGALRARGCQVAHLYGDPATAPALLRGFGLPYLSSSPPPASRLPWKRTARPAALITPLASASTGTSLGPLRHPVPEAVAEHWFETDVSRPSNVQKKKSVGSFGPARKNLMTMIERVFARIERVRDDVEWSVFDEPPTPEELATVDLWADPAESDDLDGFVAEALVSGKTVVATRTPINLERLNFGRDGILVPPSDPNEMTHAILTALFKPEAASLRTPPRSGSKFRPAVRAAALTRLYETVTR